MRLLLPLAIFALATAAPAGAQQAGRYATPDRGEAREGRAVRGALAAESEAPAANAAAPAISPIPAPNLASPSWPAAARGQCRLACDRAYYFCLSDDDGTNCPGEWSRCRAGCD